MFRKRVKDLLVNRYQFRVQFFRKSDEFTVIGRTNRFICKTINLNCIHMKFAFFHLIFCFFSNLYCFRQINEIFSHVKNDHVSEFTFPQNRSNPFRVPLK